MSTSYYHIPKEAELSQILARICAKRLYFLGICGIDGLEGQLRKLAQGYGIPWTTLTTLQCIDTEVRKLEEVIRALLPELPANCTPAGSPSLLIAKHVLYWGEGAQAVLGEELGKRYRDLAELSARLQAATILAPQWP